MELICQQEKLNSAVNTVQKAVPSKSNFTLPASIHLQAKENQLILESMDLETAVQCAIDVDKIEKEGEVLLPARYFIELVRKLPSGEIRLKKIETSNALSFIYGNSQSMINGFDPADFPSFPAIEVASFFTLPLTELNNALRRVSVAASKDDTRPVLTGILWKTEGDELILVATDGHRLAYEGLNVKEEIPALNTVIPTRHLMEAMRLFQNEEFIEVAIDAHRLLFQRGGLKYFSRLLEGQFPDYKEVIPQDFIGKGKINSSFLMEALERISLFASEDTVRRINLVKMTLTKDFLKLESLAQEIGQIQEILEWDYEGEELEIGFNAKYLLESLRTMDIEEIEIKFTGAESAAVITGFNSLSDYLYLLLPVRLN